MKKQLSAIQLETKLRKKYYFRLISAKFTDTVLFIVVAVFLLWNIEYRTHTPIYTRIGEAMSKANFLSVMFSRNSLVITGAFAAFNVIIVLVRIARLKMLRSKERKPMKVEPAKLPRDVSVVAPRETRILCYGVSANRRGINGCKRVNMVETILPFITERLISYYGWQEDMDYVNTECNWIFEKDMREVDKEFRENSFEKFLERLW